MAEARPPAWLLLAIVAAAALAISHSGELHRRAGAALDRGLPAREAELARGFVIGEDEHIDPKTTEDFRRAGLSHLLAVSGQNVALLALLAAPLLAALGIPLRARLLWLLALIAVYVPIAGAGPSIQRAAVMGALSVLATMAGRRASRFYPLAVAAVVTLAINPAVARDVGWQLSFAAVLGILLFAPTLRRSASALLGRGAARRALSEAAAMTIAATLATAPLIAYHFGELSTVSLAANLLAAPAVAPAMWLGMIAAAAGQIPGFPVEAVNALNGLLLAYIAQIASWCARPSWALLDVHLDGAGLAACYGGLAILGLGAARWRRHRRISRLRRRSSGPRPSGAGRAAAIAAGALGLAALASPLSGPAGGSPPGPPAGLRISVLDVGQGDAILLQPARAPAVLVDGGPPGDDLVSKLAAAGVARLGAAVITHDQSDHAAGVEELLGRLPIARLEFARLRRRTLSRVRAAGVTVQRIVAGDELRSGHLRLDVLWPPRETLVDPPAGFDPNSLAVVLLARWRRFTMLLSADAEAATTPIEPGPLDVLKVAHHGSDDAGLAELLERSSPRLAIISVGAANPYGHPTPSTLATLAAHGVRVLRTDRVGTVRLEVGRRSMRILTGG